MYSMLHYQSYLGKVRKKKSLGRGCLLEQNDVKCSKTQSVHYFSFFIFKFQVFYLVFYLSICVDF